MEGFVVGFITLIALVIILMAISYELRKREKERQEAQEAYRKSLKLLKASPANPEIKERTLLLGRKHSNLARYKKGVTLYDEVALMNDINAACAAAAQALPKPGVSKGSLEERLQALEKLRSGGMINDEESQTQRMRILDDL